MRKKLIVISSLLAFCVAEFALGEENALNEQLQRCAGITNVIERLACFDQLAANSKAVPNVAPVAKMVEKARVDETPKQQEPSLEVPAVAAIQKPEPAADVAVVTPAQAEKSVGKKYLPAKEKLKDTPKLSLLMLSAKKDRNGRWVYTFENGQIWRQLEARYAKKPDSFPVSARLNEGVMGSYALRIGTRDTVIKVKRLK